MSSKIDKVKDKVKGKVKSAFADRDLERKRESKPPENMATSITRGFENVAREEQQARSQSVSSGSGKGSTWDTRFTGDSKPLIGRKGSESGPQGGNSAQGGSASGSGGH